MLTVIRALVAAMLVTLVFGTVYVAAQQIERQGANDTPQRLGSQIASELTGGESVTLRSLPKVDLATSLASFAVVVDSHDHDVTGNATLDGTLAAPPNGVIDEARRSHDPVMVTWSPTPTLRFATVSQATSDGRVIVTGQSLLPSETRTDRLGLLIAVAWIVTLAAAVLAVVLIDRLPASSRLVGGSPRGAIQANSPRAETQQG